MLAVISLVVLLLYLSTSTKLTVTNVASQRLPKTRCAGRGLLEPMLTSSQTLEGSGFMRLGHIIWGGSVVHADGKYHIFASSWSEELGHGAWVTSSEVVHAVSDSALGPFEFRSVVLPRRGPHYWDGMATHNPTVHYCPRRQIFALYYIGITYDFAPPEGAVFSNRTEYEVAWNTKRIGVAISRSVHGPWRRMDQPILQPRPGEWDGAPQLVTRATHGDPTHGPDASGVDLPHPFVKLISTVWLMSAVHSHHSRACMGACVRVRARSLATTRHTSPTHAGVDPDPSWCGS
jgi:hypothetical protein